MFGLTKMEAVAVVVLLLFLGASLVPALSATVNAKVYPKQGLAFAVFGSDRVLNFTYPSDSFFSRVLSGKTGSLSFSESGGPTESGPLLAAIREQDPNATIINYTLTYSASYEGTETYYTSTQNVTLSVWLANVTQLNSSKLYVNTAWRAFSLRGSWDVSSHGQMIDVNELFLGPMGREVGPLTEAQLRARGTLEFQLFNAPLSAWSRSYNPISGITTFRKTEPANKSVLLSLDINGQNYTLYVKEDPSATLQVQGYAVPAGSYVMLESPPATVYLPYALGVAALIVVLGTVIVLVKRRPNARMTQAEGQRTGMRKLPEPRVKRDHFYARISKGLCDLALICFLDGHLTEPTAHPRTRPSSLVSKQPRCRVKRTPQNWDATVECI